MVQGAGRRGSSPCSQRRARRGWEILIAVEQTGKEIEVEVPSDHCSQRECPLRVLTESGYAVGDELLGRVLAGQELHDLGGEDLSAGGCCAEPGGLDHGITEVVAILLGRLPGGDPDAHAQVRSIAPTVVSLNPLLDAWRRAGG